MNGLTVILIILGGIGIIGSFFWYALKKEHTEAKNIPLAEIDFTALQDGQYKGGYAGGMYGWRANACKILIRDGKVWDIQLLNKKEEDQNQNNERLYDRVIQAQSLQVDTISGATLTSKAQLKAIENALQQAQKE